MFRVLQRNDIDPNYVVRINRKTGVPGTNLDLMKQGYAPYTIDREMVNVHHIGQDARGPWAEVSGNVHRKFPHKQFGRNKSHPTNPAIRTDFDSIREAYWRAYAEQFK